MSTQSAARHTAAQLKRIAQRQVKTTGARPRPIRPSEQYRRFVEGEELWRLEAGHVTPEQWQRYVNTMTEE